MTLHLVRRDDGHSRRVPPAPKSPMQLYELSLMASAELLHGISKADEGLQVAALRRMLAIGCLAQMAADELEGTH